jgi:hypothetical protein
VKRGLIASCLGVAALALAVPAALVWAAPACADSWPMPETTAYFSPSKGCRVTVVPLDFESQLEYFEAKLNDTEKTKPRLDGGPRATLERRLPGGRWERIWSHALVNDVAPVDALVSDGMNYVVTFDNWHSTGYGDDTVAIYDIATGGVRTLSAEKLVGTDFFAALPHSISSVDWRGTALIAGSDLVIDILVPSEREYTAPKRYVRLAIDLASGAATERNASAWKEARASADRVNAAARAYEQAQRVGRIAPLLAPWTGREVDWHDYLREAFWRVDPDWIEGYPATNVLLARSAPNYHHSVGWVTDGLRDGGDVRMFAGADEADLLEVLERGLAPLPRGTLRDTRIYVVASEAARPHLTSTFAPSRAKLVLLDPARPIPQRPERLPRADGSLPTPFDFRKSEDAP